MALTEKAQIIFDFLKQNQDLGTFSAKDLSEKMDDKVSAATLNSLEKRGILEKFDTTPKTYSILNLNYDGGEAKTESKGPKGSLDQLFELERTIGDEVQAILHWMNSDTYSSEPGSQVGIYGIKHNNKVIYVGKTERPFSQRWEEHKQLLLQGKHHSPELQKWFDSQNRDLAKISFEIIQELPNDSKTIDLRERYWIEKYNDTILNYLRPKLRK